MGWRIPTRVLSGFLSMKLTATSNEISIRNTKPVLKLQNYL